MTTELTINQKADKFRNRRRLAWLSFVLLTVFGGGLITYGVQDAAVATNISALSFLIGTVFGVWASIVLSYVGAATINQMNECRHDAQTGDVTSPRDTFEAEVDQDK